MRGAALGLVVDKCGRTDRLHEALDSLLTDRLHEALDWLLAGVGGQIDFMKRWTDC